MIIINTSLTLRQYSTEKFLNYIYLTEYKFNLSETRKTYFF